MKETPCEERNNKEDATVVGKLSEEKTMPENEVETTSGRNKLSGVKKRITQQG